MMECGPFYGGYHGESSGDLLCFLSKKGFQLLQRIGDLERDDDDD